jgi:hypothetical protein
MCQLKYLGYLEWNEVYYAIRMIFNTMHVDPEIDIDEEIASAIDIFWFVEYTDVEIEYIYPKSF